MGGTIHNAKGVSLQSLTKKITYRPVYNPVLSRHFLNLGSLFSSDSSLHLIGIKLTNIIYKYRVDSSQHNRNNE